MDFDDEQIQRDVIEELSWEPALDARQIGVTVQNGIVTLTGSVSCLTEKLAAEEAVKRVKGVKAVAEEIALIVHPV